MRFGRAVVRCAAVLVLPLPAAACASAAGAPAAGPAAGSGTLDVVASTNVWGDIAATIGGDRVRVTSLISDPSADPHSFEASARTRLAVSRADVVIENGGGYDDFMTHLVPSARRGATVIDAVDVSGKAAAATAHGTELNEHIWYDLPSVRRVADRIATALGAADAKDAATFRANGTAFAGRLDALAAQESAAAVTTRGAGVAVTEPVPLYMLAALGAVDRTPAAFSRAVEEGNEVSPSVLKQTIDLFSTGAVRALVYNEQTTGAETEEVQKAAAAHSVAVVGVTESLPRGQSYLSWMRANLTAITRALSS